MSQKTTIKIFIASAGEMHEERKQVDHVFTRLSKDHKHLTLEPVKYEYDIVAGSQTGFDTIQDAINPILKDSHFGIFIFHSKIGKHTKKEAQFALENDIKFFTYFKKGFSPELEEIEGYNELLAFRKSLSETVLKQSYTDDFDHCLYETLNQYLLANYALVDIEKYDKNVSRLSESNLQLIALLAEKEAEIKDLKNNALPDANKVNELEEQIEAIKKELFESEEIRRQQAREKEELERQLLPQKEKDELKSKAFDAVEKGNYDEAEEFLKESAKQSIEETANTFYELGKIKKLQFKYAEALYYFDLAAKIDSKNSLYLNEAGTVADDSGYYNQAIQYYEQALAIDKQHHGEEHPDIATRYNNLGGAYKNKGEYDKAIQYFEQALAIDKKFYGEEHPQIAIRYSNLGSANYSKVEFGIAIQFFLKALSIFQKFLPPEHPNIKIVEKHLATAQAALNTQNKTGEE